MKIRKFSKKRRTKKIKQDEFKKMITEMEQSVQKDNEKCNASCNKNKTNYAKDKNKHQLKQKCHHDCWKKRIKTVKAFHKKYPKEFKGFVKNLGGGGGSRRKSKKGKKNSAYFEYKETFGSKKFWRIVKNGSSITTHYGKFGTLGQMTTKDYGSKVDQAFDSLLKSKKDKGYVEKEYYGHVSESNPKPPTKVEREYMKTCNKAEQNKVLNPNMINYDCEGMMDQGDSELKWMTGWYKDALKNKDYDWSKYNEHTKSKRKKK
jgi:predicted DNA-binding WGR domain protein